METSRAQPNIIILIVDAVRAKHMSAYGYPVETTSHLDAFAADNVLFRRAFSPSTWTIPTHASMLSGLYLSQHRVENVEADRCFNEKIVTLPQALRSGGYRTAAFSQNMLFSPAHHLGGFDQFYEMGEVLLSRPLSRFVQHMSAGSTGLRRKAARYVRKVMSPRLLLDAAFDWISAGGDRSPFFLMVNVTNAHYPWALPPDILLRRVGLNPKVLLDEDLVTLKPFEFNSGKRRVSDAHRQTWRRFYDAALTHVDREVGRFVHRLSRWKGWGETIFVVTADHGEGLGDYRDIVGHTLTLHDNIIHVPLIIRHPQYPKGMEVEGVVQTLDLYPSIVEWAELPPDRFARAQMQRPPLSKAMAAPHDCAGLAFAEEDYTDSYDLLEGLRSVNPAMDPKKYPRQQIAVHSATHKYIWFDDRPGEFYDMAADPQEEHDLTNGRTATEQAALTELQQALETWRSGLEVFPPRSVDAEMDGVILERLRDLGYVA
jgi:arylsulfatase A-like enzyme